ncbi:FeoA family protein [Thiocystis violascens]|uniref:Fe2+ transport system protein A n=1 Tax=Thiocystis violascens (strain ATCC 17096 / DSM 198 / 6111) TaxID=765911 RepID=I3Y9E4_THIV6|nr:ferrous iron transport protein A [Thiocystis violascens]AFL73612.1 Fe2+ transport system protein A [Thiocystis violascens DSM 198]
MPQPADLIRLTELPHDTPARLAEIRGGRHLTRRLMALGLRQGSLLQVLQQRGQGLVLASGEARIAVGTGIADKLWVALGAAPTEDDPARLSALRDGAADPNPVDTQPGQ